MKKAEAVVPMVTEPEAENHSVPLNKLAIWSGNVRKTPSDGAVDALASSIASVGLISPLTIMREGKGYVVVAGQLRLKALQTLADEKRISKDYMVPCRLVGMADALEISLAENAIRSDMHPADQFVAFAALADRNIKASEIAARFGVQTKIVTQRLALGRVAPALIDLYRDEKLDLDALEAFTVTDNQDEQLKVWEALKKRPAYHRDASDIRELLTNAEIPYSDKRVKFVGVKAYRAAGGEVRTDLFQNEHWVKDAALLDKLVEQKLADQIAKLKAEGWKWVEFRADFGWQEKSKLEFDDGRRVPLTDDQKEALKDIKADIAVFDDRDDDLTEEESERYDQLEKRRAELEEDRPIVFSKAALARGGAVITLGYHGVEISRGLVRKEDRPKPKKGENAPAEESVSDAFSNAVKSDMKDYALDALQAELADDPDTALIAVVASLAVQRLDRYYSWPALDLRADVQRVPADAAGRPYIKALEEAALEGLPSKPADVWGWAAELSQERLLKALAVLVAPLANRHRTASKQLVEHLNPDIRRWYTPTAENYFGRVAKPQILKDIADMGVDFDPVARFGGFKKGDLAKEAAKVAADAKGWLPEPMRPEPLSQDDLEEEGDIDDEETDFDADEGDDLDGEQPSPPSP